SVWGFETPHWPLRFSLASDALVSRVWFIGSRDLLTLSMDGTLTKWSLTPIELETRLGPSSRASLLSLAPSGDEVAIGTKDGFRVVPITDDTSGFSTDRYESRRLVLSWRAERVLDILQGRMTLLGEPRGDTLAVSADGTGPFSLSPDGSAFAVSNAD